MNLTKENMIRIVQTQLAVDLNCTVADLNGEKDSFVFTEAKENPGRRPFTRNKDHFDMLSMGNAIIVSATPEIMNLIKPQLQGKTRDEAFTCRLFTDTVYITCRIQRKSNNCLLPTVLHMNLLKKAIFLRCMRLRDFIMQSDTISTIPAPMFW
jgi:hypothetical protein